MNVATIIAVIVGVLAAIAGFIMTFGRRGAPRAVGLILRLLAFVITLGISIAIYGSALGETDQGFVTVVATVPLLTAIAPLVADVTGRAVAGVTAVCASLMLACGIVLALGVGFYYLAPALALGIAAVTTVRPAGAHDDAPQASTPAVGHS